MTSLVDETEGYHVNSRVIFYPLLGLTTAIWILYRWQQNSHMHKLAELIPGPAPIPIFGNALTLMRKNPHGEYSTLLLYVRPLISLAKLYF